LTARMSKNTQNNTEKIPTLKINLVLCVKLKHYDTKNAR